MPTQNDIWGGGGEPRILNLAKLPKHYKYQGKKGVFIHIKA